MEQLRLNQYRAPDSYYNQYKDQEFFNYQYMNYVNQLNQDMQMESDDNYEPYSLPLEKNSQISSVSNEDREEGDAVND